MKEVTKKNIVTAFWMIFGAGILIVSILFGAIWVFADIPSFQELENPESKLTTQVISADGVVLASFHKENRSRVIYDELPEHLVNAAIATEDVRFYDHSGIDFVSLGRVLVKTILMNRSSQGGGSTITQQLAKTLYKRDEKTNIVVTKLKEWITALKLERSYTKEEILTMYMNEVEFGSQSFGVKAASQTFFGKHPIELTVEEAAMLVGMVNKPTRYNPVLHPDHALTRRNFVISQMAKADFLTQEECDSLQQIPINLNYRRLDHNVGLAPYFRDMIRRTMSAKEPVRSNYDFEADYKADMLRWETDGLYGWLHKNKKPDGSSYNLFEDGLKIYTTIDSRMQKYAEEAVEEHLGNDLQKSFWRDLKYKRNRPFSNDVDKKIVDNLMKAARRDSDRYRNLKREGMSESEIQKTFSQKCEMRVFAWNKKGYVDTLMTPNDSILYYKSHLRAGFMAVEPHTGYLKAYVGGPDYTYLKYDNVRQAKRQVGSTIKPFLYTLAMQEGMTPCDEVVNVPQSFIVGDDSWTPASTDKPEWIGETVTLKWGLTKSSNNISAYLMKQFGPQAMVEMMNKMGVCSHLDVVPSLCVGAAEVYVYDMVAAYNTFPSEGVYINPIFVTRIEDNMGNLLGEFKAQKREAISDRTAYLMVNLMQGVVNSGTGVRLRVKYGLKGQIAGKTGTTNSHADGWFIGYTPKLTAGAWVGAENQQIHFESLALGGGSNMALPIWGIFMKKVLADESIGLSEEDAFIAPQGMDLDLSCTGDDMPVAQGEDIVEEVESFDIEEDNFFE